MEKRLDYADFARVEVSNWLDLEWWLARYNCSLADLAHRSGVKYRRIYEYSGSLTQEEQNAIAAALNIEKEKDVVWAAEIKEQHPWIKLELVGARRALEDNKEGAAELLDAAYMENLERNLAILERALLPITVNFPPSTRVLTSTPLTCLRCGHEWISRAANPVRCQKCQSPYWNRPTYEMESLRPKLACLRCGHEWASRSANPVRCPRCQSPYWNRPRKEMIAQ